jgi:RND family efflux transporter MFP subunit
MLPAITVAAVETSTVEKRIDAIGASRSAKSVTLIAEATGLVKEVRIKSGQKVAAGDLLLQIDDSEQRFALTRLKSQYPIAKANAERYADLLKNNAASRLETEAAFNAYKAIEAELKAAEFAVSQRAIRAPFAGVVGLTSIEPGDYIRAGEVATTIDDLSALVIEFTVPQESAGDVKPGQMVKAVLASSQGESVEGEITAVDSRVDAVSRTLKVEATFANEGGALLPGATYAVTTTNAGAPALSMPGLAAQWDRTGAYVWKLDETGAALRVGIRILQRRGDIVVAEGDLKAGDLVIVEGADRVRPGMQFPDAVSGIALSDQSAAG